MSGQASISIAPADWQRMMDFAREVYEIIGVDLNKTLRWPGRSEDGSWHFRPFLDRKGYLFIVVDDRFGKEEWTVFMGDTGGKYHSQQEALDIIRVWAVMGA